MEATGQLSLTARGHFPSTVSVRAPQHWVLVL